jgi:hypothetical protein
MFRRELEQWEDPTQKSVALSPTAQALAEHIEAAADDAEGREHNDKPAASKGAKPTPAKKKGR